MVSTELDQSPLDQNSHLATVLDDARARHQAVVDLILFTDQQSTVLLQIYITVAVATAAGSLSAFTEAALIPKAAGWGLLSATAMLVVGSLMCLRATTRAAINLPGRGADFWSWVISHDIDATEVSRRYLEELGTKQTANRKLNEDTADALFAAKVIGMATPLVAVGAGLVSLWCIYAA